MTKKLISRILIKLKFAFFGDIYSRIDTLEYRSFNRRFYAIEQCAEYLVGAQLSGDYFEFGVWKGDTFIHAYRWFSSSFKGMYFYALDSFEGLPRPKNIDNLEGYSSHFYENQFSCDQEQFIANLKTSEVDLNRVRLIKGWFDDTLVNSALITENCIDKVAVAWIDCDLYESTVPVLRFLTNRLEVGSIIAFDDWGCFRNNPNFGQQKACEEWLGLNKNIKLAKLFSFGWNGAVFTVVAC